MNTSTTIPSYREGLNELQENLGKMLPKEALDLFSNDAETLQADFTSVLKVNVGEKAPDFSLSNATGDTIRLTELLQQGKVVLTFYRGSWCPYCSLQLNQYQSVLDELKSAGAQLVAISPQSPDESLSLKEKNELQFEVLSDNGNRVAREYTTVFRYGDAPVELLGHMGIDFEAHYTDDSHEIPVPAVFIINQDRTLSFAQSEGGDYRNRVEVCTILEALNS